MRKSVNPIASRAAAIVSLAALAACASTPPPPAAVLAYAPTGCSATVSLDNAKAMETDEKTIKRATRNRTVMLDAELGLDSDCLAGAAGDQPYQVFALPELPLDGGVVYAGTDLDTLRAVMPEIATLDADGEIVRRFDTAKFRRYGARLGHSFRPREGEAYVMIAANPAAVGDSKATVETSAVGRNVTYAYGTTVSGGVDTVGIQNEFERVYSYEGKVGIRVVYPKAK